MALIAQHTYDLRSQRFVQHPQYGLQIGLVPIGDGALLHVLARPAANLLDVGKERLVSRFGCHFLIMRWVKFGCSTTPHGPFEGCTPIANVRCRPCSALSYRVDAKGLHPPTGTDQEIPGR